MPTLCMHGTTRFSSLSISLNTCSPMRAMMRMFTTTYGESVSCTPICDMGEPTGPMLNASTYIVRPRMHPLNRLLQLLAHLIRVHPVVGRSGVVFRQRADERAVLHARHIARVRARIIAARPKLLVQLDERAARHHLGAQRFVFFFRAVHPMDIARLGQLRHLLHPPQKMLVGAERPGHVPGRLCGCR